MSTTSVPHDPTAAGSSAPLDRHARIGHHLSQASELLCLANRKGVRIPPKVLAPVIEVDRARSGGHEIAVDLETRFWHAYGILRRTIEPATRARRHYRVVFYVALLLMLVVQGGYLIGSRLYGADTGATADTSLSLLGTWMSIGTEKAILNTFLDFVATYLLPALYGLLGACAFVLRQLCEDVSSLRFADDSRVRYTLRLNIGLIAGLAVGWFIDPKSSGVANLSPLALAFVAGYGSDLLFAVMDRIVQAFSGPAADDHDDALIPAEPQQPAATPAVGVANRTSGTDTPRRRSRGNGAARPSGSAVPAAAH
jgi:hypothetical protein